VAMTFPTSKMASARGRPRSLVTLRISGAAAAFPYAPDHALYFNAAKRTSGADHGWLMTAERPETRGFIHAAPIRRGIAQ